MNSIRILCITAILSFTFAIWPTAGRAQTAQQQDTVKDLSKDLGDLNRLVMQLRGSEQQRSESTLQTWPESTLQGWPGSNLMVHIDRDIEGKAQPSQEAKGTVRFRQGETAQVLERRGDWALVKGQDEKVAWVGADWLQSTAEKAFDAGVEQIIRQLQKMRAKYQQGPVVISGFSIDVKIPPGASVEFTFK